jgi:8-oxo-dGTP diphosphatase
MEPAEDIAACMIREIREEAGIEVTGMSLRGTVNWTGFGNKGEDWIAFIFLVETFTGEPHRENVEGPLEWVEIERLAELPMWEGDRYFLPLVFDDDPRPFHGYLPYKENRPVAWSYTRL